MGPGVHFVFTEDSSVSAAELSVFVLFVTITQEMEYNLLTAAAATATAASGITRCTRVCVH